MNIGPAIAALYLVVAAVLPVPAHADTYVIPFSDIRQAIDASGDSPDAVIQDYLTAQIREELDALGLNVDGGLVFAEIPVDEITETIRTDCSFFRPYQIHTDATTATITIDDGSSLTLGLDNIRSVNVIAELSGTIEMAASAWVRWGQDVIFIGDCVRVNTDHGWIGLTLPFEIDLQLALSLDPVYDSDLVAIVVDKHASLTGQVRFNGGDLQHEFGTASLTDLVLNVFEDELLGTLHEQGEQAVSDAITVLNFRLDGLDDNGVPDPEIVAFNGPTTFVVEEDEEDWEFVSDLLEQFGVPHIVISMLDDRGIEILLQLAVLEGAERDAYLAALGAEVSCDALLGAEIQLDNYPIYALDEAFCEAADVRGPQADAYFTDMLCRDELAFRPTDATEYCLAGFAGDAESLLGNAAAWQADTNQPNDPLPQVASRSWTTVPGTQLDLGVMRLSGNHQPFVKQVRYKRITDVARGNGVCELEMRVYKSDPIAQDLAPLIALHGGAWQHRGFSFRGLEAGISHFTERGFIVFAPFYRLAGESDGNVECNGAGWREITEDVATALDWVLEHGSALGAADGPVSVFGQSAGANLAAWLAAHRGSDVRNALLYYAPTDALEFLGGAVPAGGPYEEFRRYGIDALAAYFGAGAGSAELRLDRINFAGLDAETLESDWSTLIPDTVFDLNHVDPQAPPSYLARCAISSQVDLLAINLAMPPAALSACLRQELARFLIENSFNHLLAATPVPIHVVQGSADTLVPYQQAINLCGAIDQRVFPTDVVDPLTSYSCGAESRVQIVRNAEHALELGLCLGALCPGGEEGSDTRAAVATAIGESYLWLQRGASPPLVNSIEVTKAWWYESHDKLAVWASSDRGAGAGLQAIVLSVGGSTVTLPLAWNGSKNRWQINVYGFTQDHGFPVSATVSGAEGAASAQFVNKLRK